MGVACPHRLRFPGFHEPFLRVLSDGLLHLVAALGARAVNEDQRLVDEARDHVEHHVGRHVVVSDSRFYGVQRRATREDRHAREDQTLRFVEKVVGPVDCGTKRLMTLNVSAPARQQPEPLLDPTCQLSDTEHTSPCGRELDREWHTVEPVTELRDDGRARLVHREARVGVSGPLNEQLQRRVFVERRDREQLFTADPQPFTARRQDG